MKSIVTVIFSLFLLATCAPAYALTLEEFCDTVSEDIAEVYIAKSKDKSLQYVFDNLPDYFEKSPAKFKRFYITNLKQGFNYGQSVDDVYQKTYKRCINTF